MKEYEDSFDSMLAWTPTPEEKRFTDGSVFPSDDLYSSDEFDTYVENLRAQKEPVKYFFLNYLPEIFRNLKGFIYNKLQRSRNIND